MNLLKLRGTTGKYAACALRKVGKGHRILRKTVHANITKDKRGKPRQYGEDVFDAVRQIGSIMNFISANRLKEVLPERVRTLMEQGEINVDRETRRNLLKVGASTIDWMLSGEKKKMQLRGRTGAKPGIPFKHQIPVRKFPQWDGGIPGFLEVGLVGHDDEKRAVNTPGASIV